MALSERRFDARIAALEAVTRLSNEDEPAIILSAAEQLEGWLLRDGPVEEWPAGASLWSYADEVSRTPGFRSMLGNPGRWVSQETWDRWSDAAARLAALEAAGVDNWEGYGHAMAILEGDEEG